MPLSSLSLGRNLHCSTKHKLQLVAECTVQISGLKDFAQARSYSQQLDLLTNRDLWVKRGQGLQLSFQILLNGQDFAAIPGAAEVVETLGSVIRDAEVSSSKLLAPGVC